jgi:hypothetical protein
MVLNMDSWRHGSILVSKQTSNETKADKSLTYLTTGYLVAEYPWSALAQRTSVSRVVGGCVYATLLILYP